LKAYQTEYYGMGVSRCKFLTDAGRARIDSGSESRLQPVDLLPS